MVSALRWIDEDSSLELIDQTQLPGETRLLQITTTDALVRAIEDLAVRGAPALGVAGAFGVAIAMQQGAAQGWDADRIQTEIDRIRHARPTAVNLAWGVDQVRPLVGEGLGAVVGAAKQIAQADESANRELSRLGADWILTHCPTDKLRVITHCNTGALATSAWGTAYGIIHELHDRGKLGLVYADETRPLLQGSRLTSWELVQDGIEHVVEADGAASSTILRGLVDVAIIGADRIAANGDTANKIGSVALALACQRAGIPFIVAAPYSTVDLSTASGEQIHVEQRDEAEVLGFGAVRTTPAQSRGFNPAFDVTPHDLISAIATEKGIAEPAHDPRPRMMAELDS
ncbi:S-methyl-5-thioribose-1-phosphate isomerase [Propionimicrobium sp. PCR01-08-3]|uniref:S-methyl-5-thioribose-1-phosphate isomerase n=1 Tax=Propionimicrobium sp. PCR01-08-3 TaxID=3052086 RepID=UPI00255D0576|nr:S-methyl-5-thioribose-1-phosphate isomerase [Propionimicrobium sp. PCR01-08-3]WIY82407.1 S-methyl-5-thioribose-1-phosphate isomerase [Propionimicrobium sp. PCR01-08-3]